MLLNKIKMLVFIIFAFFYPFAASASDPTTWHIKQGIVGVENFQILFPTAPKMKHENGEMILYAHDGNNAMYMLKVFNPPQPNSDAGKAFAIFRGVIGQAPKSIVDWKTLIIDGNPVMDVETVNSETHVKAKYRYMITPNNVWEIKTVFDNASLHHNKEFTESFKTGKTSN